MCPGRSTPYIGDGPPTGNDRNPYMGPEKALLFEVDESIPRKTKGS